MSLISELVIETGFSATELLSIIGSAPARYKVFPIAKRSGGVRIIAQPSRELKFVQRYILERTLSKFPIHSSALGYALNRNIFDNASIHKHSDVIMKLDFEDFFPSIKPEDWQKYARRHRDIFEAKELNLYTYILFWGKGSSVPVSLSIGAPTSPILSNIVMFDIDSAIYNYAIKNDINYTRYADDITISGSCIEQLIKFEKFIKIVISKSKSPVLRFNDKKRGIYTKSQRRMVTGLIITNKQEISIGRARKRMISALIHRFSIDQLGPKQTMNLKGLLGFCLSNEPKFFQSMQKKYGPPLIRQIQLFTPVSDDEID